MLKLYLIYNEIKFLRLFSQYSWKLPLWINLILLIKTEELFTYYNLKIHSRIEPICTSSTILIQFNPDRFCPTALSRVFQTVSSAMNSIENFIVVDSRFIKVYFFYFSYGLICTKLHKNEKILFGLRKFETCIKTVDNKILQVICTSKVVTEYRKYPFKF